MKIYSILLLTTMCSVLGADKRIIVSTGLGTVCMAIVAYKAYHSNNAGKEFDGKRQKALVWINRADEMKNSSVDLNDKDFELLRSLYEEAKRLGVLRPNEATNETIEGGEYLKGKIESKTFDLWVKGTIWILGQKYGISSRPPLFTTSTSF